MDGGFLAIRNSADHPYCFLSNQKQVQILPFLHVISEKIVSCQPGHANLPKTDYTDKGRGHDRRLVVAQAAQTLWEFVGLWIYKRMYENKQNTS